MSPSAKNKTKIDDVRIYNRALTAAEVTRLHKLGTGHPPPQLIGRGTLVGGVSGLLRGRCRRGAINKRERQPNDKESAGKCVLDLAGVLWYLRLLRTAKMKLLSVAKAGRLN